MKKDAILSIFSKWAEELNVILTKNDSLFIAIFSTDRELLFANNSMSALFKSEPCNSFINPTFDKLLSLDNSIPLIFDGFLTLGDYSSVNTSIEAQVYRKDNSLLVVGGVNTSQLIEQNKTMHQLNLEISNLERELLREKNILENTLKQLNQANEELKELNTSKDRFISILAHDLRGPFSSILGFLDLLTENIREYDIDKIESQINIVNNSAKNTFNLLEDILMWVRANSDKIPYEPQKLNFGTICTEVTENLNLTANTKDITINHSALDEVNLFADKNMLTTVLRNLISNSIKFTNKKGQIDIYAETNQTNATITISDNGIGIKPDSINKLFDISQKITTTGTANEKGAGLGLLLCKEFVEKHGGKIWVESEVGKGSTFYFTLPYNTEPLKETIDLKIAPLKKNETVKKLKILIAEDDEISEMLIDSYAKTIGKEILKAKTGVEAVEACRNNPDIDLILMDIQMPEMGGYEATRQIREFNKDVVIIAQTAYGEAGDKEKAIEAGCNDYISKLELIQKYFGK